MGSIGRTRRALRGTLAGVRAAVTPATFGAERLDASKEERICIPSVATLL